MIRNPAHEQRHRLTIKTLDQVFIMRVKEGLAQWISYIDLN